MEGKLDEAQVHLKESMDHSTRIGYRVGSRNAESVLSQVEKKEYARQLGRKN